MTEHRSSEPGPLIELVGDKEMLCSGVIHWWENTGDSIARAIIIGIVKA